MANLLARLLYSLRLLKTANKRIPNRIISTSVQDGSTLSWSHLKNTRTLRTIKHTSLIRSSMVKMVDMAASVVDTVEVETEVIVMTDTIAVVDETGIEIEETDHLQDQEMEAWVEKDGALAITDE